MRFLGLPTRSDRAGALIPTIPADLRRDGAALARPVPAQRRRHLRGQPACARGQAAGWKRVAEHRHRGEEQGRRDARRVPRAVSLQPARRPPAQVLLDGRAGLAVGRPRGDEQLVAGKERRRRPEVQGEERAADGRARHAGVPRIRADAAVGERGRARLPADSVRPAARRLRDRHAQLSRPEHVEPPAAGRSRDGVPGASATGVAAARTARVARRLWKAIASDMPIGLQVGDGKDAEGRARWEAVANGDGGPAARPRARDRGAAARR